jgi:hypothetical protein
MRDYSWQHRFGVVLVYGADFDLMPSIYYFLFVFMYIFDKNHGDTTKPATGEGMDKSTLVHTQIQMIIIHFLPSPFTPIPNG